MIGSFYNTMKNRWYNITSGVFGNSKMANYRDLNTLVDAINRNNGGNVVVTTYKADVVGGQNVLVPIHIKGGDVLPLGVPSLDCECNGSAYQKQVYKYTNGMNGCVSCTRKANLVADTDASEFSVSIPSGGDAPELPNLSDFTLRWAHIDPAYNIGIEKTGTYAFSIKVYDIANDTYITTWPTGLQIDITSYYGDNTEG